MSHDHLNDSVPGRAPNNSDWEQEWSELRRLQAMEIRLKELLKNYGSPGLVGADTIRKAMK